MGEYEPLAVITGGTSGIGLASARRLMAEGYQVLVTGRDEVRGQAIARELSALGTAEFLALDSARFEEYPKLVQAVGNRPVKALVTAAAFGMQALITETDHGTFMDMMAVNVAAPLEAIKCLTPLMAPPAAVVLISSDAGVDGEQGLGAYSVTKAALNMAGRMAALDLAPRNIRVNVVCPGDTEPGMRYLLRPGETQRSADDSKHWPMPPLGRFGRAEDTAELVAFLVSARSAFVVGSVMRVDGGSRAGRPAYR